MSASTAAFLEELKTWCIFLGVFVGIPGLIGWGIWTVIGWLRMDQYKLRFSQIRPYLGLLSKRLEMLKGLPDYAVMARPRDEALLNKSVPEACRRIEQIQADFELAEQAVSAENVGQSKKLVVSLERQATKTVIEAGALLTALGVLIKERSDVEKAERAVALLEPRLIDGYAKRLATIHRASWKALEVAKEEADETDKNYKLINTQRDLSKAYAQALSALTRVPMNPEKVEDSLKEAMSCRAACRWEYWKDFFFNFHRNSSRTLDSMPHD